MGYGNPMFDGDEPLPQAQQRIISMRVWLSALRAGTLGEGAGLPDRHHDDHRRGLGAESQWRQGHGPNVDKWNQRG